MNKCPIAVGFHTGSPSYADGWGDYIDFLAENGHPIIAVGADAAGFPYEIQEKAKSLTVPAIGIWRKTTYSHGDDVPLYHEPPEKEALRFWKETIATWPKELDKEFVYVSMLNEPDKNQSWYLGKFAVAAAEFALEHGYRMITPAFSAGEPERYHWDFFHDYLEMCSDDPEQLAISTHEYNLSPRYTLMERSPDWIGRIGAMNEYCINQDIKPPDVFIKEFGWGHQYAPHRDHGVPQIIDALQYYAREIPNIKGVAIWALDKDSKWGNVATTVNSYMGPLSKAINQIDWPNPGEPEQPSPPETERPKIVIFKAAQEHTALESSMISEIAYNEYRRTVTASLDDMITMLKGGNDDSYSVVFDPEHVSQVESIAALKGLNFEYEVRYLIKQPNPTPPDIFKYRPCDTSRITQYFGANPSRYQKFGLPGHEGIDYGVPMGHPFYAVQDGEVVWASDKVPSDGRPSNYGYHVYLKHTHTDGRIFHTVYAHGKANLPVKVGDEVKAGQIVAYSGNTGFSSGPHIHFGLLIDGEANNGYPQWTFGQCIDPLPFLEGKDAPVRRSTYDMLDYLRGDGRMYEVRHDYGATETFQTQTEGDFFYLVKNYQYEQFKYDNGWVWRGRDTSPGPASADMEHPGELRFYDQFEIGDTMARWCKRHMYPGETFIGAGHEVQFRYQLDCSISIFNSGPATNVVQFVAHHAGFDGYNGIRLDDVIELKTSTGEHMYFAKDYGLVGWTSPWGESKISEILQGRPDLTRNKVCI